MFFRVFFLERGKIDKKKEGKILKYVMSKRSYLLTVSHWD
jgi:hypothetical protein